MATRLLPQLCEAAVEPEWVHGQVWAWAGKDARCGEKEF